MLTYLKTFVKTKTLVLSLLLTLGLVLGSTSLRSDEELKSYLSKFIEQTCCYTNNCCWSINSSEVLDLGEGRYRILSTGQELAMKDYSPDGQYWRCACDYEKGQWIKHEHANTRCLYVPRQGS